MLVAKVAEEREGEREREREITRNKQILLRGVGGRGAAFDFLLLLC